MRFHNHLKYSEFSSDNAIGRTDFLIPVGPIVGVVERAD